MSRLTSVRHLPLLGLIAILGVTTPLEAQDWRSVTMRRETADERELRVNIEFGVGKLKIEPASGSELFHAAMRYDATSFEPISSYEKGTLRLGTEGSVRGRRAFRDRSSLSLGLGATVPLDLSLAFGAVEAELELGGLRVRTAKISTGASETKLSFSSPNLDELEQLELKVGAASFHAIGLGNANVRKIDFGGGVGDILLSFDGEWQTDTNAVISLGVGSLTLVLPRDIGVNLNRDTFLVSFDPQGLIRRGDGYYSEGWENARHRLTIDLKGAFGSVNIRWAGEDTAQITSALIQGDPR